MSTTENYRYPGSRPFRDTDYDRRLFFGRDKEKQALLHLVLAENLVVLFAKSGMGKTSLINAGLLQSLREREFWPVKIRFNDSDIGPIQAVYSEIEDSITPGKIEYTPGMKDSFWEYFKTAEFWSSEDKLLTPVLILDQFEEFFMFHSPEQRTKFIEQLADLEKEGIPKELQASSQSEETHYTEISPHVKILIAIREDYLGLLEEVSQKIPAILQNRFRLLPLNREQAQHAIVEPAKLEDTQIATKRFCYTSEALNAMLDFLCKRIKRRDFTQTEPKGGSLLKKWFSSGFRTFRKLVGFFYKRPQKHEMIDINEVEPFQLQLLCQHLENLVSEKSKKEAQNIVVQEDDLGGETGMQQVLQNFYDTQTKQLVSFWQKRKVRKLCENGLVSGTGRRLSLEEEEIERRFNIPKSLLVELVNSRLLRAEPRVGSVYYELSHDTLVEPIRLSQHIRKFRRIKVGGVLTFGALFLFIIYILAWQRSYVYTVIGDSIRFSLIRQEESIKFYQKAIELDPENDRAYFGLGIALSDQGRQEEAGKNFEKFIQISPENADAYYWLGRIFRNQDKYEEAAKSLKEAIKLKPKTAYFYGELGDIFYEQRKYDEAIEQYQEAVRYDSKSGWAYKASRLRRDVPI